MQAFFGILSLLIVINVALLSWSAVYRKAKPNTQK